MRNSVSLSLAGMWGGGISFVGLAVTVLPVNVPIQVGLAILFIGVVMLGFAGVRWLQGHRDNNQPKSNKRGAIGIKYGPQSRGGTDEDSTFQGFGEDDTAIEDHGQENRHVRPKINRKPKDLEK